MRSIVASSLRFRALVVLLATAMMVFGVSAIQRTPVDVFPEFAPPRVEIQTPTLGLSAAEVEEFVTVPLEQQLNGVPGVDTIRSSSVEQLSSITLILDRDVDYMESRQLIGERLAAVARSLPSWAAPPHMMQPLSSTSRVMKIGLSSDRHSLIELSSIARHKIRQRLLRVDGVANVAIWGQRKVQRQVLLDPERMRRHRISLQQALDTTGNALDAVLLTHSPGAVVGTGGFIDTPNQRLAVRHMLPTLTPRQMANVPVEGDEAVRLGDVAEIVTGHPPLVGDAVVNDGPGLLLIVEKFPSANTLEVTRGVEEALAALGPGLEGIRVDSTIFRPATFIEMALDNVRTALLIGCALVVLVLVAFLFEWRTAFISLISIPLSLMGAALVLAWRGETINVMILAGLVIAVGVVVDDAIIDIENVWRRLRLRSDAADSPSIGQVILEASLEVRSPIVYATLINVAAIVPVFFMEGLSGAFFEPLALSYGLAVLTSMVVALTVTPALSLILLRRANLERPDAPLVRWLKAMYGSLLARSLGRPLAAYGTVAVLVLGGVAVLPQLGQSLLPNFKERDFLMHWLTKPGTSLPEETRISRLGCRELREIPGVRNCGSHIGQAAFADEVVNVDFGENWISVDPDADYDATVARIQTAVEGYPGLFRDVLTYLRERVREVLTGASDAVVVRIFGPDLDALRSHAEAVRERIADVDGLVELHVELQEEIPHIEVEVDLAAARRYGVKPGDVRRAASYLVQGIEVNDIWKSTRVYDVNLWSTPKTRRSLTSIRRLPIDTPSGQHVPLGDLARVRVAPTPNIIERENVSRRIDVSANVAGRHLDAVVDDIDRRLNGLTLGRGYHVELLGESAEQQGAQSRLMLYGSVAAIAILLLLQAAFRSWTLAAVFFLTLPMALVGGVLAAFLTDGVISLGSMVGFLTVFGIAARNGILLINHYQHLEREEGEPFGRRLVLRGAQERLSPIMMTALATALALVPLAIAGDIPGHEIEHPMAIVILGGLATSTFVNLFVVPSLYLRFGRHRGIGRSVLERAPAA
jgi:CzcA family heavy metal efflux pump